MVFVINLYFLINLIIWGLATHKCIQILKHKGEKSLSVQETINEM